MNFVFVGNFIAARRIAFWATSFGHAFHFKQDPARLDHGNPSFGSAFAFTHAGFGRFLGDWFIRENPDPDGAATFDGARHGDTSRLDLTVGDPAGLKSLQRVVAEREVDPR
jgi:hypothetical protein